MGTVPFFPKSKGEKKMGTVPFFPEGLSFFRFLQEKVACPLYYLY
jgi:hypothetical protein